MSFVKFQRVRVIDKYNFHYGLIGRVLFKPNSNESDVRITDPDTKEFIVIRLYVNQLGEIGHEINR